MCQGNSRIILGMQMRPADVRRLLLVVRRFPLQEISAWISADNASGLKRKFHGGSRVP
jgi:hypothetical protein